MSKKRVYLAHNYEAREYLRTLVPKFEEQGLEISARWVTNAEGEEDRSPSALKLYAETDIEDIDRAHTVIYFIEQFNGRPGLGKHFELGYAYGSNPRPRIILIGDRNVAGAVFYWLSPFRVFSTIEQYLESKDWLK